MVLAEIGGGFGCRHPVLDEPEYRKHVGFVVEGTWVGWDTEVRLHPRVIPLTNPPLSASFPLEGIVATDKIP